MDKSEQLKTLLDPLLDPVLRLPDEAWLPAAVLALRQPADWVTVFSDFDADKQELLLDRFTGTGANAYTDILLLLLVEQPAADADSVAMLTHFARCAADRHRDRMAWIDRKIAELTAPAAQDFVGRQQEYAARLLELQSLWLERVRQQPQAWQVINQEMALARLEWKLDQVAGTVRDNAAARDALQSSIAALETQIAALKSETANFQGRHEALRLEREQLLAPVETGRNELQALEKELTGLRTERKDIQAAREKAQAALEHARQEIVSNRAQTEALEQECRQIRESAETMQSQLQETRNALNELQRAPELAKMAKLQNKLAELWKLLPADDASAKA